MTLKLYMSPRTIDFGTEESGIRRICEALEKYLPAQDIEFVGPDDSIDVTLDHAGALQGQALVTMCAGVYWTADYPAGGWEYKANANVISALRQARQVIVPSNWVALNIARNLRFQPHVIGHGIEWDEWQGDAPNEKFILWAKNRTGDVCDPLPMYQLAQACPSLTFVTTFLPPRTPALVNISVTGQLSHRDMNKTMKRCGVYLSTTKETFGIATLEAMAAGRPVLGFRTGGNLDLIHHGVTGYLAEVGNQEDLLRGLYYCLEHAKRLGDNGREWSKRHTWDAASEQIATVLRHATTTETAGVSCIIPCHNYADKVGRAIRSVLAQTHPVQEIIVLNDASDDDSATVIKKVAHHNPLVKYVECDYHNVAKTRNKGIELATSPYIMCLDADDAVDESYVEQLLPVLQGDRSLGAVYSRLRYVTPDGNGGRSDWPAIWDFDAQLNGHNQVPTCCLFRKEMWARVGGYNPRCCPQGAGWEDADLWLRMGEYGWSAKLASDDALFTYSLGAGHVTGQSAKRVGDMYQHELGYYQTWYPWYTDHVHPWGSQAHTDQGSHPIHQLDEPIVSIIIPVGPGHEESVVNALQSVEAQTIRDWELIVVWDSAQTIPDLYRTAYPFVTWLETGGARGTGYARNRGAEVAKSTLLLFLDADDWLYPTFLSLSLDKWRETGHAIYTDYIGKAIISDDKFLDQLERDKRLLHWSAKDNEAVIAYHALDFDCQKALREPAGNDFYVWCNITTLHPKAWWIEVGGFDEAMSSWEDWDYWLRLAQHGHCFTRITEPLMVYRFYTGGRRDSVHQKSEYGRYIYEHLLQYLHEKYARLAQEGQIMPCQGCGQKRTVTGLSSPAATSVLAPTETRVIRYMDRSSGDHWVDSPSGLAVTPNGREGYGYHASGDEFEVYVADIERMPLNFIPITTRVSVTAANPPTPPPLPALPALAIPMIPTRPEIVKTPAEQAQWQAEHDSILQAYLGKDTPQYQEAPAKPMRNPRGRPKGRHKISQVTRAIEEASK